MSPAGSRWTDDIPAWAAPVGVALVAFVAYLGVWSYGYASDDVALISRLMSDGWDGIRFFLHPATGATGYSGYERYYRPLWVLVTAIGYSIWGASPAISHLFNLLLFAATCAAFHRLVALVTGDRRTALWSALVFALHPIHTMNVIWISGRTDGLATLGIVMSVIALLTWRERRRMGWMVAGILFGVAALASKEMGYLVTPLVFVSAYARTWRERGPALREGTFAALPALGLTAAWAGFVLLNSTFVSGFDWVVSPKTVAVNWAGALVLTASPVDYELLLAVALGHPLLTGLGAAFVTLVAGALAWRGRRDPALLWAVAWTLIGILPLYRLTMRWYLLLPSVGMAALIGVLIRRGEQSRWSRGATLAGTVLLLLFAVGLSRERDKWSVAQAVNERALSSLAAAVRPGRDVVVTASPAKARRMPVFGGNTESFVQVRTGSRHHVDVLATLALEREDASVRAEFVDATHIRLEIDPMVGAFDPAQMLNRRGRAEVGYRFSTDRGTATVEQVSENGLPVAIVIELDRPRTAEEIWLTLNDGRFVPVDTEPKLEDRR